MDAYPCLEKYVNHIGYGQCEGGKTRFFYSSIYLTWSHLIFVRDLILKCFQPNFMRVSYLDMTATYFKCCAIKLLRPFGCCCCCFIFCLFFVCPALFLSLSSCQFLGSHWFDHRSYVMMTLCLFHLGFYTM